MAAAARHSPAKSAAAQRGGEGHLTSSSNGVDSIWKACAYGDYDKLCRYVEQQPELVNQVRRPLRFMRLVYYFLPAAACRSRPPMV